MRNSRLLQRTAAILAITAGASLWSSCSDDAAHELTGPSGAPEFARTASQQGIQTAIAAQERHSPALLRIPGVVGTAVGLSASGETVVRVFLATPGVRGVPAALDGVPVTAQVTGQFMALSDPTTKQRPAPMGFSVGHPDITAGTIGARVVDGSGNVYVLSNNHVLANSNAANIGDPTLQPGTYDGGTPSDQIATLSAFSPIDFSASGANTMDAAIALSNTANLANSTPTDDGYGTPNATIFGDANDDGFFDNKNALLGLNVQKYGRTTKLTHGTITGINATVTICYEAVLFFCLKSAVFVDQLIIEPGGFSDGGDSGSLIVTDDQNKNPVALLFAGSATQTIANRIDLVLAYFDVSVDAGTSPPPTSVTDIAITSVSAPSPTTEGDSIDVVVTVRNVGNEPVGGFGVSLTNVTDNIDFGTQPVPGLAAGATATLSYGWNTTGGSIGDHTLTASHDFLDENASNDQRSTVVTLSASSSGSGIHIGDLDAIPMSGGRTWSATVEITVHDANHNPINGATVTGAWIPSGLASDECVTGELGGNGTCIVLYPSLRKKTGSVTFTVNTVMMPGQTYQAGDNHDVDGSSNGTSITVNKP